MLLLLRYSWSRIWNSCDPVESISQNGILEVGETWTHIATYTVTQADIDAGIPLVNTISVVSVKYLDRQKIP
jgi:hypothetical protein